MANPIQKQKFYVIGHNPNTVDDAKSYMRAGCNAIEPDIRFHDGHYYVCHDDFPSNYDDAHRLETYLAGLAALLNSTDVPLNLALIAFDFKTDNGRIFDFLDIVQKKFSSLSPVCGGVAILVTEGSLSGSGFLGPYLQNIANAGVGIDEESDAAKVQAELVGKWKQTRFAYADGIVDEFDDPDTFKSIMNAKGVQAAGNHAMKLVYTWVLALKSSMRSFLELHIDGIMVDLDVVPDLLSVLKEKHFLPIYELAQNGYNPWDAPPIPNYLATVNTSSAYLAGTDAKVTFTLSGTGGALQFVLDGNPKGVLEQGATDFVTFQGMNIGQITKLELSEIGGGIDAQWLPLMITIQSDLMAKPVFFNYNADDWVKPGQQPLVKFPDSAPGS